MFLKVIRLIARLVLPLFARIDKIGFENLPKTGGALVATNHLGRLDAILGMVLSDREDVIMLVAEKYQKYVFWRWVVKNVDGIWLNRNEADFHALRLVHRRLRQGGILAIAPEGTRSQTEALIFGKPGAAYLAARANVPVIPAAISGTEDRVVKERLRRWQRLHITITLGEPLMLPPMERKERDDYLQACTDEIMCRIAALLPGHYRGVYANHPRLQELLQEQQPARAG